MHIYTNTHAATEWVYPGSGLDNGVCAYLIQGHSNIKSYLQPTFLKFTFEVKHVKLTTLK